jgi:DNA repair exonuclease SbcCD ATPase subunit
MDDSVQISVDKEYDREVKSDWDLAYLLKREEEVASLKKTVEHFEGIIIKASEELQKRDQIIEKMQATHAEELQKQQEKLKKHKSKSRMLKKEMTALLQCKAEHERHFSMEIENLRRLLNEKEGSIEKIAQQALELESSYNIELNVLKEQLLSLQVMGNQARSQERTKSLPHLVLPKQPVPSIQPNEDRSEEKPVRRKTPLRTTACKIPAAAPTEEIKVEDGQILNDTTPTFDLTPDVSCPRSQFVVESEREPQKNEGDVQSDNVALKFESILLNTIDKLNERVLDSFHFLIPRRVTDRLSPSWSNSRTSS